MVRFTCSVGGLTRVGYDDYRARQIDMVTLTTTFNVVLGVGQLTPWVGQGRVK